MRSTRGVACLLYRDVEGQDERYRVIKCLDIHCVCYVLVCKHMVSGVV